MSKTVDQRIVEMRFDNNQFEQNVKTSMNTLDKLKHALKLDGASKGLDNVSKASKGLDFSSIANNVQALSDRFSTMGIIGMRVLERMTDSCINFAQRGIGFVTNKIIEGGKRRAFNIENAHFQLQGLLKDEEKVQAVMADAMESVDGTAYAYDEAAKAASQFAASGLQAGDEMLGALKGITGVAAMTNSEYEGISRIFTTIAGNGRMMGDQLLQLSSRGLNAASTLAEYFNGVKDGSVKASDEVTKAIKKLSKGAKTTEADIREMVSDGKISFKIFAAAMDSTFGEHAKKANETFTGAMSNIGAALARIGAKFVSPLIEQNGPFVQLFNTIRTSINAINKMMDPFADRFTHNVNEMAKSLNKYLSSFNVTSSIEPTMKKLQRVFGHLTGIAKEVGNILFPFLKRTVDEFKMFGRVLNGDHVSTPLDRLGDALTHVHVVLGKLAYSISQNHTLMQNWRNTIRGVLAVFDILGQVIRAVFRVFGPTNAEIGNAAEGMLTLTGGVGEYLYSVDQWLRKTNAIEESLRNFKKYVTDAFNAIIDSIPGLRETLNALEQTFSNITSSDVVTFFNNLEQAFTDLINNIAGSDLKGMEFVRYVLTESKAALEGFINSIVSGEQPLVKALNAIADKFREVWVKVEDLLKKAKDRFNLFIQGLDFQSLGKDLFKAGSILYALYELRRLVNTKIKVGNSLAGALNQIKFAIMDWRKGAKWNILIKIATGIAILAGSLFLISKIEPDNLMPAVRALGILGIYLVGFFEILQLFEKSDLVGSIGPQIKGLYAVVIALAGMAFILVKISAVPWDDLKHGLIAMAGLIAGLSIAAIAIGKSGKSLTDAAPGIAMAVVALLAMVGALYLLQFINFDEIGDGLIGLAAIMTALYFFCKEVGKLKLDELHIDPKTFVSLIPLAASIAILAVAVRMLSGLDPGELATGLFGIAGGMVTLVGAMYLLAKINVDSEKLISAAGAMMMVAIAINMLVPAILILGAVPWQVMARGMGAVVIGIAALAGALWLTSKASSSGQLIAAGAGMMMIAVAMNLLLPVVIAFGLIPFKVIGKGIAIFLGALLGFAVVGAIASGAAVGLYALGASLLMISTSIAIAGVGLSLIAGGIMQLTLALGLLATVGRAALPELVVMLKDFLIEVMRFMPDIIGAVAEILGKLLSVLLDQVILLVPKLAEALTAIVLALIATLVSCVPAIVEGIWVMISEILETLKTYVPTIVETALELFILVIEKLTEKTPAVVHALAEFIKTIIFAVLDEIKKIDTSALVENLQAVGLMAALLAAFAGLSVLTGPALIGVFGFGVVVSELALILAAVGKLSEIPGLQTIIGSGGDLLKSVGTAIGKFVGGIAGGFMNGVADQLPEIGKDLSAFMNNMEGFISGCEKINPNTLSSAKTLSDVVIAITLGSVLDGITRFLGLGKSSLTTFGEELAKFGPHFAAFADSISNVKAGTVIASARAAESLTAMAKSLPNSGGMVAWFSGDNSLSDFAEALIPFGEAMSKYSAAVDGKINVSSVEASARAGTIIAELAKELPNSGGVVSWFSGDNSLKEFAESLEPFGKAMADYSAAIDGKIDDTSVRASVNCAKIIADFASNLPNTGGFASWFTGDNTLSAFGQELSEFGPKYAAYAASVNGVPAGVVMASAHCIEALSNVANGLSDTNGLAQVINGGKSLADFGRNLELLGNSYSKYYTNISKTDAGKITESIGMLKEFVTVAGQITGEASTGLSSLSSFITQAASVGKDLMAGLSKGVSEGATSLSQSIETIAKSIIETTKRVFGVHSPSTVFAEIGRFLIEGLANGITKAKAVVQSAIKTLASNLITSAKTGLPKEQFSSVSNNQIIGGLTAGLNSGKERAMGTVKTICDSIILKFKTCLPANTFKSIGSGLISAIITGMETKKAELTASVKRLCDSIANTFKNNINVNQYREIGLLIIQSIVSGIQSAANHDANGNNPIAAAVKSVSDTIISTFKTGLSQATFINIGKNVAAGLEKGIKQGTDTAKKAAEETAKAIVDATKDALGVHSPSTVYAEIGKHVDEGLAEGIRQYTSIVEGSSEEMADRMIKATQAAYLAVNYILEHGLSDGPVIKPVVDLTNADYALHRLQNEFGNGLSARMASNINIMSKTNSINDLADRLENINTIGNKNVVGAIEELRSDVDRLNQSMSHLQVIMDSGALVGSIAPSMDMQLGKIAKLKARGV